MIDIVLYQPKIPQNTGNIIRFCANMGLNLQIIHPMGFVWDDKKLRRAGLDYAEFVDVVHYQSWDLFVQANRQRRRLMITTKGEKSIQEAQFLEGDLLIFGSEDAGIPLQVMQTVDFKNWVRVPMKANSRSMNLSNTVAIVGFEANRQLNFPSLG